MTPATGCAGSGGHAKPIPLNELRETDRTVLLRTVDEQGTPRRYAVVLPRTSGPGPAPVIVFLNGRGECGTDGLRQLTVGLGPAALDGSAWDRFLIIAPQKPAQEDTWEEHSPMVLSCLDAVLRDFASRVDTKRVYLTGLSQGGAGTWAIASLHPDRFAAAAPVCGFVHVQGAAPKQENETKRLELATRLASAQLPLWAFHGERDDVVAPEQTRRLADLIRKLGGDVQTRFYAQANHNSWDATYRDDGLELADWFLSHHR